MVSKWDNFIVVAIMTEVLITGVSFYLPSETINVGNNIASVSNGLIAKAVVAATPEIITAKKLVNPPAIVKAVFVTGSSAGSKRYLNYLSDLFNSTEINAVVVDIKGSGGYITYDSGLVDAQKYNLFSGAVKDVDSFINFFHDKNIYVIGRIAVFEDPVYSKARPELAIYNKDLSGDLTEKVLWKDNNGLTWLDPASKDVWDYNISLAKNAFYHGFDEINFDYVRFPTDGNKNSMGFPVWKAEVSKDDTIKEFFQYVRTSMPKNKLSIDLFGQTTTSPDGMGIGQLLENAFESFDYVSPMVYPSHYITNFMGFINPAEHPYEIIKKSMDTALGREELFSQKQQDLVMVKDGVSSSSVANLQSATTLPVVLPLAKFRPWLQDFNMGADYTADMVKQEIKATQDALGITYNGFMLWNASNIYTAEAVAK